MPSVYIKEFPAWTPHDANRRENGVLAARLMANAALTAPKGGGVDSVECAIVYGEEDLERIAREVEQLAYRKKITARLWRQRMFTEAVMVRESDAVLFIGSYRAGETPLDAGCGFCGGGPNCRYFYEGHVTKYGMVDRLDVDIEKVSKRLIHGPLCTLRVIDFGIAVGAAVKLSTNLLVDAMPFFSVGMAGLRLGYCRQSHVVVGVCISSKQKNPYVDVLPDYHLMHMEKVQDTLRKNYVISRIVYWFDYRNWVPKASEGAIRRPGAPWYPEVEAKVEEETGEE